MKSRLIRIVLGTLLGIVFLPGRATGAPTSECCSAWRPSVRWRGFNLQGMFMKGNSPGRFVEEDFQLISEWGFNFVRLPLDYRYWTDSSDWEKIVESELAPIDEVIAWARKYGLHVQLAFHRAPGYTIAKPGEKRNLFRDEEAQHACARHWAYFAKRYRDVPNDVLSFNLVNEPTVAADEYAPVAERLLQSIWQEDPHRFVISDGVPVGRNPVRQLFPWRGLVGQSLRGYLPMGLSHYLAPWAGSPAARPCWPTSGALTPLRGPGAGLSHRPLTVVDAPAGDWEIQLGTVSGPTVLEVRADGVEVLQQRLTPISESSHWRDVVWHPEWRVSQGRYVPRLLFQLVTPKKALEIRVVAGDWVALEELHVVSRSGQCAFLSTSFEWETPIASPVRFRGWKASPQFLVDGESDDGCEWIRKNVLGSWKAAFESGAFVMVGELGAQRDTPHEVMMAWMEDQLSVYRDVGIGWAVWNFRGACGPLDSGRKDVHYEDCRGHKLDRKLLELLQKY